MKSIEELVLSEITRIGGKSDSLHILRTPVLFVDSASYPMKRDKKLARLLVGLNYRIGSNRNIAALRALVPSVANALPVDTVVSPCG